jgi:hypothetical protein
MMRELQYRYVSQTMRCKRWKWPEWKGDGRGKLWGRELVSGVNNLVTTLTYLILDTDGVGPTYLGAPRGLGGKIDERERETRPA